MVFFGKIDIEHRYRLRWRFDLPGKPPKVGIWNNSGGKQLEGFGSAAWCVNKTGLIRAAVEAEPRDDNGSWTGRVVTLAECDGWDFVNFAWIATTPLPCALGNVEALSDIAGQVTGLTLETRDFVTQVRVDGTQKKRAKTDADKRIHLAGFGK